MIGVGSNAMIGTNKIFSTGHLATMVVSLMQVL